MFGNLSSKLKSLTSRQKSRVSGKFGKDAMKRKATGGVRGEAARKQADAESRIRGDLR